MVSDVMVSVTMTTHNVIMNIHNANLDIHKLYKNYAY